MFLLRVNETPSPSIPREAVGLWPSLIIAFRDNGLGLCPEIAGLSRESETWESTNHFVLVRIAILSQLKTDLIV